MRLGMIGLGKMGLNMSRRLINNGHEIFAYDALSSAREVALSYGIKTFESIASMTESLGPKKIVWVMLPDTIVEQVCNELKLLLTKEDIVIDGGNCHFEESIKKFNSFATMGIEFMDVGVSGGVFGLDRGYCLMIGGNKHTFDYLKPIFKSLSPSGNATEGFLYCGKSGAGHYVKMVHNGIEYAIMQLISEVYDLMHRGLGLSNEEMHQIFHQWNQEELNSFLIEITADIFKQKDVETGKELLDVILDKAGAKGTGKSER